MLYNRQNIREIEKNVTASGMSEYDLMQNAGRAAFQILRKYWTQAHKIIVLCGGGNNGGDGYVLARYAKEQGLQVTVYFVGEIEKLHGAALLAWQDCLKAGVNIQPYQNNILYAADVIVDALIGIGLRDEVREPYYEVIENINRINLPVLSIDTPSGIEVDTGRVLGIAVHADVTITFIGIKQGLCTGQSLDYVGKLICDDLDIEQKFFQEIIPAGEIITYEKLKYIIPPRKRNANKGNYGHVLIIGGEHGYVGATCMAAEAAARVGAGLVSVATRHEHTSIINSVRPEVMAHGVTHAEHLQPLLEKATVVAIGPGLGQAPWGQELLECAYNSSLPMIADADALNILALKKIRRENLIITPHPGEAARLLNVTTKDIQADRFHAIKELQKHYADYVVLKGAGSLVVDEQKHLYLCSEGNPGMASGGMGDVLTGIIAGLMAQHFSLKDAAKLGVCIHAHAADLERVNGERGMLALDLMPHVRRLVNL